MQVKISILFLLISCFAQCADVADKNPTKHVILISPSFMVIDKDTTSIISSAKGLSKLVTMAPMKYARLAWNHNAVQARGEEIARETPGTACAMRKLFEELGQKYGLFSENELKILIANAIQPTKKPQAFELLQELKKAKHCILCVTSHDAEEHEVFRDYLRDNHKACFTQYIDGVITVPHYKADVPVNKSYWQHPNHTDKDKWLIAHDKSEQHYLEAFEELLKATNSTDLPVIMIQSDEVRDATLTLFEGKQKIKIQQDDIGSVRQHLVHIQLLPGTQK